MYGLPGGSDVRLRGTDEAVMTRQAVRPLKILAVVGAAFFVWGLLFAYASSPAQAATLTVNSLADGTPANDGQCTLREAILNANANDQSGSTDCATGSGSDALRVGVAGTVQLSGALPNLSSDMQIEGPGADQFTVKRDTGGDYRIFTITSDGTEPVVSISGITISGGNAFQTLGGGILNFGTLTVTGSTIRGNSAIRGGGISNHETLTVTRSTISGNSATLGGGIYSDTDNPNHLSKKTTVTNSTISGNSSTRGGGVRNWDGLTVIEHSTITKNTAPSDGGSGVASSADVYTRTEVLSSIISDNQGTDVDFLGVVGVSPNTFVSKGYNLIGSGKATGAFSQEGDQTSVGDPKLGALANNGGLTQTHALLPASPAIDKGKSSDLATDQRGKKRPFDDPSIAPATGGDNSDIGSFEAQSVLNTAPQAKDDAYSTDEDTALTVAAPGVLSNDTSPGDKLTAVLVGGPSHADSFELNANGSFSYTPKKDYNGPDSFTYKATGGSADSNVATVNITVSPVNDVLAAADDAMTTAEDTAKKVNALSLLSNDSNVDGDAMKITGVGTPAHGTATLNDNGTPAFFDDDSIDYAPAPDYNGPDSFTHTVSDGKGGTATATVNVKVTPVNDAPAAANDSPTTDEDAAIIISVLSNDSDVDGDSLSVGSFTNGTHGTVTRSTNGTKLTYTPKKDYNGPDSFTYKATDGTEDSNTATVSIQVNPVDDAPKIVAVAGSASQSACLSNTSGRITLKLSDVDSNPSDLKPSVASSSDTRLVPKSNVVFGGTGGTRTATISTVAGRTGTSTVTITVSDGQGSSSVSVTVKAGGKGRDTLGGTSGSDLLLGQNGDDTLSGAGSNDVLCGANGNDRLNGGAGSDTFDGGAGTDAATDYNAAAGDSRTNIP